MSLQQPDPTVVAIAREIARTRRSADDQARASQASRRSVELDNRDGVNFYRNGVVVGTLGPTIEGDFVIKRDPEVSPIPPVPSAPVATGQAGGVAIVWDGTFTNGEWNPGIRRVEVHAVEAPGDPTSDATQISTFSSWMGGVYFHPISASVGELHYCLQTVSVAEVESAVSGTSAATALEVVDQEMWQEHEDALLNLNTVVLPALQDELDDNATLLQNLTTVVLPDLQTDVDDALAAAESASDAIAVLNDTTLPNLQLDLDTLETNTNNNTLAINSLEDDLLAAQGDLDAAETAIANRVRVIFATAQPAGLTASDRVIWYDTDGGYAASYWDGVGWGPYSLGAGALAADSVTASQIAAGAVTATELAADSVIAEKIQANAVVAGKIAADAVTATTIAAGAVTAGKIAALSITAAEIAATTITGAKIAADTITATQIAADAITANELAANAVTAAKINALAVVAGKIAADAVTATEIAANSIVSAKIAADAVVAGKIAANAVTATTIAADAVVAGKIAANAVTATTIAADAVTASKIAADAITSAKIAAGAIDGKTITGALIQSSGTANTGLKIVGSVMTIYDASNNPRFVANGDTGEVTVVGKMRTAFTGKRVEIGVATSNASALQFYSGVAGEIVPSGIYADPTGMGGSGTGFMYVVGPQFNVSENVAALVLGRYSTTGSDASLSGNTVQIDGVKTSRAAKFWTDGESIYLRTSQTGSIGTGVSQIGGIDVDAAKRLLLKSQSEDVYITPAAGKKAIVAATSSGLDSPKFNSQVIEDTDWMNITLSSGWSNYDSTFQPARFRVRNGVLYYEGLIKGTAAGSVMFNLPAPYRHLAAPGLSAGVSKGAILRAIYTDTGVGRADIRTDGNYVHTAGGIGFVSVSSFPPMVLAKET